MKPWRRGIRPGFTVVELIVVVLLIVVLVAVLLLSLGGGTRTPARQLKDATQLRTLIQAMAAFSLNSHDAYPTPSRLDGANGTMDVGSDHSAKDNTGNILSVLVYLGAVPTEGCISWAEANTSQVVPDDGYEFVDPSAALAAGGRPDLAVWDPGFAGTPLDSQPYRRRVGAAAVAHQSYAHMIPAGRRLGLWSATSNSTEAVFGNRGPAYQQTAYLASGKYTLNPAGAAAPGVDSYTLLIHGDRNSWWGNIAYNDGSVVFETNPTPAGVTYRRTADQSSAVRDHLFIDETDEYVPSGVAETGFRARVNNYLRPTVRLPDPGAEPKEGSSVGAHLWVD